MACRRRTFVSCSAPSPSCRCPGRRRSSRASSTCAARSSPSSTCAAAFACPPRDVDPADHFIVAPEPASGPPWQHVDQGDGPDPPGRRRLRGRPRRRAERGICHLGRQGAEQPHPHPRPGHVPLARRVDRPRRRAAGFPGRGGRLAGYGLEPSRGGGRGTRARPSWPA